MNTSRLSRQTGQQPLRLIAITVALLAALASSGQTKDHPPGTRVHVMFSGGHDTDLRDRGRPVILIASALGVPPEVFRDAFTHVQPAAAGMQPSPEEVQANKAALLSRLGPYGVTNDRLDAVSDHYRYERSRGELWPATPAAAYAIVSHGKITRYVVTNGGSGYSSSPTVTISGFPSASANVKLSFSKEFGKNGSVLAISTR